VDYRAKNGPFRSPDELGLVKGIGKQAIDRNRADIRLDATKPAAKPPTPNAKPAGVPARPTAATR
jgi:competence protein ComEA